MTDIINSHFGPLRFRRNVTVMYKQAAARMYCYLKVIFRKCPFSSFKWSIENMQGESGQTFEMSVTESKVF